MTSTDRVPLQALDGLPAEGPDRTFFELSPDPATLSDLGTGCILEANGAWCALTGLAREEALGRNPQDLGLWPGPEGRNALFEEVRFRGLITNRETEMRTRGGRVLHLLVTAKLLDLGNRRLVLMVGRDVSERHQAAQALQESEERFRIMAEESPVALWLHRGGRYVYVNPAAVALLGAGAPSGLLGREVLDRVHPGDREGARARILRAMAHTGDAGRVEERLLRLDGSSVSVALVARAVTYEGQPTMLVFAQDISPFLQAREVELRALKAESLILMAGGIAHDFNNLFQALQTTMEVVEIQSRTHPDVLQAIHGAKEILRRAVTLSWKMLDFAGRAISRPVPMKLADFLATWARGRKDVDLVLTEVPTIQADPSKLEKVLDVFLENAREAMAEAGLEQGRVRLALALEEASGTGGLWVAERPRTAATVRLAIANEGPVPPPEVLARMFDPFFTTKALGRGLGLPSALGLLQAHGAGLHVALGPGGGMVFSLHFPPA